MVIYVFKQADMRTGQDQSIVAYGRRVPFWRLFLPWFRVKSHYNSHPVRVFRRELRYVEGVPDSEFYAKMEEDRKRREAEKKKQDEARKAAEAARLENEKKASSKPPDTMPEQP